MPVLFWTRTAFMSLLRAWRSTFVLSSMLVLSVATLVFLSSTAVGVNDAMVRSSTSLYLGHVSAEAIPAAIGPKELSVPGVRAVLKRVHNPGILSLAGKAEPVSMIEVDPASEREHTVLWRKAVKGAYIEGTNAVFLGSPVAASIGAAPGDRVVFTGAAAASVELEVAGVFTTGVQSLDRGAAFVAAGTLGAASGPWNAAVILDNGEDPEAAAAKLRQLGMEGARFNPWQEIMPDLKELIDLNYVSMAVVMVLVFGVVAVGISGAFSIYILKGLREYGVMRAMGASTAELTLLIALKVTLVNLFSSAAGLFLGVVLAAAAAGQGIDLSAYTSHNQYFSASSVIYPRLTYYSVCLPPALSLGFGLAAAAWPASIVARRSAAEILRAA